MKSIPIFSHPKSPELSTAHLIRISLDTPPQGGFTTTEMRSRIKILDVVEALSPEATTIDLEEADHAVLVAAVSMVRWNALDKFIIQFEDSLNKNG